MSCLRRKPAVDAAAGLLGLIFALDAHAYSASADVTFAWGGATGEVKGWTGNGINTFPDPSTSGGNDLLVSQLTGNNSFGYINSQFAEASDYNAGVTDDCLTPLPTYEIITLRKYSCRHSDQDLYYTDDYNAAPMTDPGPGAAAIGTLSVTDTTLTGTLTVISTTDEPTGATTEIVTGGVRTSNSPGDGLDGYNVRTADGSPFGNVWYGISTSATLTVNLGGTFTATDWTIETGSVAFNDPGFACQQGGFGGSPDAGTLCTPSQTGGGFQANGAHLSWGMDVDGAGSGTTAVTPIDLRDTSGNPLVTLSGVLAHLTVDGLGNIATTDGEIRYASGSNPVCVDHIRWGGDTDPGTGTTIGISCGTLTSAALEITGTTTPDTPDTTPNPFSFADQYDVALVTTITSAAVTISGINTPSSIGIGAGSAAGSQYSINGGPYTSAPGLISNGSSIRVRHTSALIPDTSTSTTVVIGGVMDTFTSTTRRYAVDDVAVTGSGSSVQIDVLQNDSGLEDPVYTGIWIDPLHGDAMVNGSPGPQADVRITYVPDPGYSGPDSFVYWVESGSVVDYAEVSVSVINDDSDDDGVGNSVDNCPAVSNPDQSDGDIDEIGDACDNCTVRANTDQRDTNADGYGNICDPDLNDSGLVTSTDFALMRNRFNTGDPDADLNGNGIVTAVDFAILRSYLNLPPGPSGLHP